MRDNNIERRKRMTYCHQSERLAKITKEIKCHCLKEFKTKEQFNKHKCKYKNMTKEEFEECIQRMRNH